SERRPGKLPMHVTIWRTRIYNFTFWDLVAKHYKKESQIQWSKISLDVSTRAITRTPSVFTANYRLSMALTLYSNLYKNPFPFICCYNLLSKASKWKPAPQPVAATM
ncbi:hypothetical protein VP01_676g4, partial [Puccinia sorghi]